MLSLYRRHRATCKSRARRAKCSCPIWVQGMVHGEQAQKSLDLTNWEAANRLINQWEIHGMRKSVTLNEACDRWVADYVARNLKPESLKKYRQLSELLKLAWGDLQVSALKVDDVRAFRERWKLSPLTTVRRLESIRGFFNFCASSGWIEKNPAKSVKAPIVRQVPTLTSRIERGQRTGYRAPRSQRRWSLEGCDEDRFLTSCFLGVRLLRLLICCATF